MSRPRRTVSARGVLVDFDLMDIKSQIAASPRPVEVKAREDFIDRKLRRRMKKSTAVATEMVKKVDPTEAVSTQLPSSEGSEGMMHEVQETTKVVKQKARKQ